MQTVFEALGPFAIMTASLPPKWDKLHGCEVFVDRLKAVCILHLSALGKNRNSLIKQNNPNQDAN
jgi:hypothetical protein